MRTTLNLAYFPEGDPRVVLIGTRGRGELYGAARRISARGSTRLPWKRGICRVSAAVLGRRTPGFGTRVVPLAPVPLVPIIPPGVPEQTICNILG